MSDRPLSRPGSGRSVSGSSVYGSPAGTDRRPRRHPAVLARLVLAGFLNVAASSVPAWQLDATPRPALTLVVGGPVLPFPPPSLD